MQSKDWTLRTENSKEHGTCVHVTINEDVDIEGLEFQLLDLDRKIISEMKVTKREIYLCVCLSDPEFVKLGNDVKYVDGSGCEFYKEIK